MDDRLSTASTQNQPPAESQIDPSTRRTWKGVCTAQRLELSTAAKDATRRMAEWLSEQMATYRNNNGAQDLLFQPPTQTKKRPLDPWSFDEGMVAAVADMFAQKRARTEEKEAENQEENKRAPRAFCVSDGILFVGKKNPVFNECPSDTSKLFVAIMEAGNHHIGTKSEIMEKVGLVGNTDDINNKKPAWFPLLTKDDGENLSENGFVLHQRNTDLEVVYGWGLYDEDGAHYLTYEKTGEWADGAEGKPTVTEPCCGGKCTIPSGLTGGGSDVSMVLMNKEYTGPAGQKLTALRPDLENFSFFSEQTKEEATALIAKNQLFTLVEINNVNKPPALENTSKKKVT